MEFHEVVSLQVERATQQQLDDAWRSLGEYKLSLRRLHYSDRAKVSFGKILPSIRQANQQIVRILDEMLKRQTNEWYYSPHSKARKGGLPTPEWDKNRNFLRHEIPSFVNF